MHRSSRTSVRTLRTYLGAVLLLITITRQVPAHQENGASTRERDLAKELARAERKGPLAAFLPLEYLAAFYREQKDWTKANDYLGKLVALWKATAGEEAIGTARFENEEGEILAELGDRTKAEEVLLHATSVLQQSPNVDVAARAIAWANLGAVCVQERKTADVERLFALALPELEQSIGPHKPWISAASAYSTFLEDNGRDQEALALNTRIKKAQFQDEYMESGAFVRPKPKSVQPPKYTAEAKRLRISGTVVLYIEISTSGHVSRVSVLRPLGLGLDEEAVRIVSTWTFVPARLGDTVMPYFGQVEVQFNEARN
jgi:TonB family protein